MSTVSRRAALSVAVLLAAAVSPSACSSVASSVTLPVSIEAWGEVGGRAVERYTLTNARGTRCVITNHGATVTELWLRDRRGELADVVLGFESAAEYAAKSPYFGCIVGRCANRIAGGTFTLEGREYRLATNNGPNHLHGGAIGFDKVVWTNAGVDHDPDLGARVTLRYRSPDGEEGYPGNLDVTVVYTLTHQDELVVEMTARTDATTLCNLAHHSYWNLASHASGSILEHELELACSRYTPTDATLIPTGELAPVAGTPFDFRARKRIGADLAALQAQTDAGHGGGYDLNYAVDGEAGTMRRCATLRDPGSGRTMRVFSDQPGLQLYTGNFLDGSITGKGGAVYRQYQGLCLETQRYPDAIHHPGFPSVVLRPGETYRHTMRHRFSVE